MLDLFLFMSLFLRSLYSKNIYHHFLFQVGNMKLHLQVISFLLPSLWFYTTTAFILKWKKNAISLEGDIKIRHELVAVGEKGMNTTSFREHAQKFANMSVDEKCEKGLDLSAAFLMYTPYVDVKDDGKFYISFKAIEESL